MDKPFYTIEAVKDVQLFVFADHASRHIPAELNNLGLSGDDLTRHIAWDIGTDVIAKYLCQHFGCAGQIAAVSRLVIDLNRDTGMPSAVPIESDGTPIPGNKGLSPKELQARIDAYHKPYHVALSRSLAAYDDPLVISMHSFTAKPVLGNYRSVDIGLLVKHDEPSAEALRQRFEEFGGGLKIGINEPYSAHVLNYTIDTAVAARGLRHLAIEIKQSHIDTDKKAENMARILAGRLEPLVNGTYKP